MKKLSTILFALLATVVFVIPAQATSATPADCGVLPVISRPEEKAFLPIINSSEGIASLPVLDHRDELEESGTLADFINSVEVRYSNKQITIYYGLSVSLVTTDCNGFLVVSRLPSEGIIRTYYNSSDGGFHVVDLLVSPGNTRLVELPQVDG